MFSNRRMGSSQFGNNDGVVQSLVTAPQSIVEPPLYTEGSFAALSNPSTTEADRPSYAAAAQHAVRGPVIIPVVVPVPRLFPIFVAEGL